MLWKPLPVVLEQEGDNDHRYPDKETDHAAQGLVIENPKRHAGKCQDQTDN